MCTDKAVGWMAMRPANWLVVLVKEGPCARAPKFWPDAKTKED